MLAELILSSFNYSMRLVLYFPVLSLKQELVANVQLSRHPTKKIYSINKSNTTTSKLFENQFYCVPGVLTFTIFPFTYEFLLTILI